MANFEEQMEDLLIEKQIEEADRRRIEFEADMSTVQKAAYARSEGKTMAKERVVLIKNILSDYKYEVKNNDYDNGCRAGMQKMRDLAQASIDEMEEALFDMVGLFSADDMLLKGTHLRAALKQARAALQTRRIEAIQRNKRNKLEELKAAREAAYGNARDAYTFGHAAEAAIGAAEVAYEDADAAYEAELKKQENPND